MLLLSIITVCRNDAARLKITIDSLRTFYGNPSFEHIVVDGESSDETRVLVAGLKKESNFRFVSKRDSGIYDAMNSGVGYSKAPLVLFLNCGDTVIASPNEIQDYLCNLVYEDNVVELDIACFSVQQIGTKGYRNVMPARCAFYKMPVSHQGMVFSRKFVAQNKYEVSYKIAGDYDLYLRAKRVEILEDLPYGPIVSVEIDGFASANPLKAYSEYLLIARKRLAGWNRVVALLHIGIRGICVISIKSIVPRAWVVALRGI